MIAAELDCGGWAQAIRFSPDGMRLATGDSVRAAVHLWDPIEGRLLRTIEGGGPTLYLSFSADSRLLAVRPLKEDKIVNVWDAQTGLLRHTVKHDGWVASMAFSARSRLFVMDLSGNKAVLRDLAD